jgi:acetyl-CoA synthetase
VNPVTHARGSGSPTVAPVADPWDESRAGLDGLPDGGLNIAHEAVDRHAAGDRAGAVALRFLRRDGSREEITYRQLAERSDRFASLLAELGVEPGERVFTLLGRVPDLYVAALGTLKHRAVLCPLFSAFGPEPIAQRMRLGDARVLVTSAALHRRRVAGIAGEIEGLRHVLVASDDPSKVPEGTSDLHRLLDAQPGGYRIEPTDPEDPSLLHFTSGTTGAPKGAVHVHGAVVAHRATAGHVLGVGPGDVYWCTADPGWVTGTSYGIIAPLVLGATLVIDEADFDATRWYEILEQERVQVWYTAPTAIRMLMRAGEEMAAGHDLSALRRVISVGEPLHADAARWGERVLGRPIHDSWWQTETGAIMIATPPTGELRYGSMGLPVPGITATVLERDRSGELVLDDDGVPQEVTEADREGELALRAGWPSMFRDYLGQHERYQRCFVGGWYRSGDLVRRDADGWFWFVGRGDDVIKTAGHLIGPTEVERALMEHPAIAEAGAVGLPDPVAGERIRAYLVLAPGAEAGAALERDVLGFARSKLGAAVAPKELVVVDSLPHTRSGKVMRRLLKARALGLDEGDTSTLEEH